MDPRLSPPGGPVVSGVMVIFEGYLEKMSELLSKWERRYFVLSHTNPFDHTTIEFAFYKDSEKRGKKKTINLSLVSNVSPVKRSSKEFVFTLDMGGKPLLLRAANMMMQNVWVAKLLECCSKDHLTYHVTIPAQPMSSYMEGLIKLSSPHVTIVSPANGAQLVTIPFDQIRRFGCEVVVDYDIIWFETCGCKGPIEQFFWFSVPSGIEAANIIAQDIKKSIELTVRSFLIKEEGNKDRCQTTYISRPHYGCNEYPYSMRQGILQNGLLSLATSPRSEAALQVLRVDRERRRSEFSATVTPTPGEQRRQSAELRRHTLAEIQGGQTSQLSLSSGTPTRGSVSPRGSPSPVDKRTTLNQLSNRQYANSRGGMNLSHSAGHGDFDSGVNVDGYDPSRHSAPSMYNVQDLPKEKKPSLAEISKGRSLDEAKQRPVFQKQKRAGTTLKALKELTTPVGQERRLSDSRDSANGSVGDLLDENGRYDLLEPADGYNHLSPPRDKGDYDSRSLPNRSQNSRGVKVSAYDHLASSYGGMALKERSKKQNSAYTMS